MNTKANTSASICFVALFSASAATAEMQNIPFDDDNWVLIAGAKFDNVDGRDALQLGMMAAEPSMVFGAAALKDIGFENGTIEYDLKFAETVTFSGIQFRVTSPGNGENFYMRAHHSGEDDSNQYMTNYNGVPSWQLYYGPAYTAPTVYPVDEWFHVKLVVQDGLADIYMIDDAKPELTIALKRDQAMGGVGFWGLDFGGPSWVSNFSIDTASAQPVVGTPAPEPEAKPGTVMAWQVSNAVDGAALAQQGGLSDQFLSSLTFTEMPVEGTGILNLAKLQGVAEGADTAIAKITVSSDADQLIPFDFGFSDDVTVYLNGSPVFSGSDRFLSRSYRFLGVVGYNDTAWLPLAKGDNTLALAVTEDHVDTTGWAVQGRFQNMDGISFK